MNRREFLEICFAADRTGLYYTTREHASDQRGDPLHHRRLRASLVLVSDVLADRILAFAGELADQCPIMVVGETHATLPSFDGMAACMPATPIADESQGLDMLYSSGTTGRPPKGVKWALPDQPVGSSSMLIELFRDCSAMARAHVISVRRALPRRPPSPHHGDDQDGVQRLRW